MQLQRHYLKLLKCLGIILIIQLFSGNVYAQTPVPMASQSGLSYTENFSAISSWSNNFTGAASGENRWKGIAVSGTGTIPNGIKITQNTSSGSTAFVSGVSGGVQKGSNNIQLLATGTSNSTDATAIDFFMDFTGVNAGTLTFDVAEVTNSSGDRPGTLVVYYSTDGTTFTALSGTNLPFTSSNGVAHSATISTSLPAAFNNSATARLRFYQYNGPGVGSTGSRPKHSIGNLTVTAVANNSITITVTGFGPYCNATSNAVSVAYTTTGSYTGTFTAQLSNSSGSFASGTTNIGTGSSPISATIPSGIAAGTLYRIRVINSAPAVSGSDNGSNITISAAPAISGATAPTPICVGSNLTLNATVSGGTSYSWSGPTGTGLGTTVPRTIAAPAGGSGIYTLTAINGSCTVTTTTPSVTVNAPPTLVTASVTPTSLCSGGTITVTSATSGAASYSWSGPGGYNSLSQNPSGITTSTVSAGVYTVTAINGVCSVTATTASVTVNPLPSPTISGSTTIASGASATLTFSGANGDVISYSWTGGGGSTATISGSTVIVSVSPTVTTGYSITSAISVAGCTQTITGQTATITVNTSSPSDTIPTRDDNMAMGNPSAATALTSNANNYLMVKSQYALSYNNSKGEPNWVSWHLSTAWKGPAPRCNCFTQDGTLPGTFFTASSSDYTGTGFDRGHLCPSEDRDGSDTDNAATFKMTNMTPQAPQMNEVTWESLESYCRDLIYAGNELYIIAGGYGAGGTGSAGGTTTTIAGTSITVPSRFFKVILVLPVGINDVSRVTTSTRVIAVDMPNTQSVSTHPWTYYRTSVDAIEAATGYDFLSNVPVSIQAVIEAGIDNGPATLVAWDFTGHNGDATVAATTIDSTLDVSFNTVTRGSGAAASSAANSFRTTGFKNDGISTSNTDYFQTIVKASTGYKVSLSSIDATFAGTASYCASPGVTSQYAYSLDGTTFTLINAPFTSIGTPNTISTIDISGISALQNLPASSTVYLRYYASGQTSTGGWGYYSSDTGYVGLSIGGSMAIDPGCTVAPTAVNALVSSASLCSGSLLTLTGSATGANSYSWNGPNGFTSSLQNPATITTSTLSAGIYTLTATNGCGSTVAYTPSVTITTTPTAVTASVTPNSICSGSAITLTGTATNATSYSWDGPNGFGSSLQSPGAITTNSLSAGVYTLTATNTCGNTLAFTSSVTVNGVPSAVSATPSPTTLCSGAALTLTGTATGATGFSWSGPGGFTSSVASPAAITTNTASAGVYTLTATNVCGSTTTTTTAITINTVPSVVSAVPSATILCSGAILTLSGSATGATGFSWGGPNGFTASVASPAPITTSTASAGVYTLTATNTCGSTSTTTSAITINTVPLTVNAIPSATALCSGSALTLTSTATGATGYLWNGPNGYTASVGNPAAIVTSTASAGVYTLTATNTCGNTTAATPVITINTVPSSLSAIPSATILCSGTTLTLTGSAGGAISYSWHGPNGFTSTAGTPPGIVTNTASAGVYTLAAINACGSTSVTTTAITINTVPTSVNAVPSATVLCSGAALTLNGAAAGATSYSWSGPNGFTASVLNPAAITVNTLSSGIYSLTATNSCGNTIAFSPAVAVGDVPANVTATPSATILCSGNTLTLTGTATGAANYSWTGPAGFTASVLNPAAIITGTASAGVYTLVATNGCGNTTATASAIIINTVPTSVTATPSSVTLCSGDPLTLTGTATGAVTYSWGGPSGYASTNQYPTAITTSTHSSGIYTLTATNSCGNALAVTASVTVNDIPQPVAANAPATVCLGATLTLTGSATNGSSYSWDGPDGYHSTDLNPAGGIATSLSAGVYTLTATNACGSNTTTTTPVVLTDVPSGTGAIASATTMCSGTSLTLTGSATNATTYTWNGPDGFTSTDQNPAAITVNTASSGVYTLTATNTCGSASVTTAPVTVNPTPAPSISGSAIILSGNSTTLTISGAANDVVAYTWTGGSGLNATLDGTGIFIFTVSPASTTVYSLTSAVSGAGCSTTVTGQYATVTVDLGCTTAPTSVNAGLSTSTVCSGDNITLSGTAVNGLGYSWSGPNGFSSPDLNPASFITNTASAGVYTLVATNACGSTTVTTSALTVNVPPTGVTATPSANALCIGGTLTLSGTASGATIYLWNYPDGSTSTDLNPAAFIVSNSSAGVYTLTAGNACGNTPATTIAVSVNSLPAGVSATPSSSAICAGATLTLTGSATNATNYSWNGPDGFTSTDQNPAVIIVSTASAGVYSLAAIGSCGTATATTVSITVNAIPAAVNAYASATALCGGSALTLTGTATNTLTYSWSGPGGYTSTDLSPVAFTVNTASTGVYTLTAANVCGNVTATVAVTVTAAPAGVTAVPSGITICNGTVLTLTGNATGATSYSWSGPGGFTSTDLNPAAFIVNTASAGIYTLTASSSCGSSTAFTSAIVINVAPSGVSATPSATSLCSGATLTLTGTATGATSYSWSGPNGFSSALNPSSVIVNT